MAHQIEVQLLDRVKGRASIWTLRVIDGQKTVFASQQASIRFHDEAGAHLLGRMICIVLDAGVPLERSEVAWSGDLDDDCTATIGSYEAHAEHIEGPRRGGIWYCQVADVLHSVDAGIVPRSGKAARWLCELFVTAKEHGFSSSADQFASGGDDLMGRGLDSRLGAYG